MRITLSLTKNKELIPFNYQPKLVSALHKWLGKDNQEHGKLSLYSFSWLNHLKTAKQGFNTTENSSWCLSFYDNNLTKEIVKGIQTDPYLFAGMEVREVFLQQTPEFSDGETRFHVATPVFLKTLTDNRQIKFLYYTDEQADHALTSSFKTKLEEAGMDTDVVALRFDRGYRFAKTKGFEHNGIFNKGSVCPIIFEGTKEQKAFAWNVGVGNSTGIGFGALV